jgi:hypothetical protein
MTAHGRAAHPRVLGRGDVGGTRRRSPCRQCLRVERPSDFVETSRTGWRAPQARRLGSRRRQVRRSVHPGWRPGTPRTPVGGARGGSARCDGGSGGRARTPAWPGWNPHRRGSLSRRRRSPRSGGLCRRSYSGCAQTCRAQGYSVGGVPVAPPPPSLGGVGLEGGVGVDVGVGVAAGDAVAVGVAVGWRGRRRGRLTELACGWGYAAGVGLGVPRSCARCFPATAVTGRPLPWHPGGKHFVLRAIQQLDPAPAPWSWLSSEGSRDVSLELR